MNKKSDKFVVDKVKIYKMLVECKAKNYSGKLWQKKGIPGKFTETTCKITKVDTEFIELTMDKFVTIIFNKELLLTVKQKKYVLELNIKSFNKRKIVCYFPEKITFPPIALFDDENYVVF